MNPKISVIITTYNEPRLLDLCLESYLHQTFKDFEIIIADDGSKKETKSIIDRYGSMISKHIWHEDNGFRKTKILNKAICATNCEYLIFTDGDCIAPDTLIETHIQKRKENHFLSGSYYKLDVNSSRKVDRQLVARLFKKEALKSIGHNPNIKSIKFLAHPTLRTFLDKITTTKPTWNGHCSSGWKKDILAINGFNEKMVYGGEDRELGERLVNNGIIPIQIRHQSCLIHLYHKQGYVSDEGKAYNQKIRKQVKDKQLTWTDFGIIRT